MHVQPLRRARGSFPNASCSPICCKQTSKALVRLSGCAGSPELSLFACAISTIFLFAFSFIFHRLRECDPLSCVSGCCWCPVSTVDENWWRIVRIYMSWSMTKPIKWSVQPVKTQISLGIHPVWSESSLSAWRNFGSLAILPVQNKAKKINMCVSGFSSEKTRHGRSALSFY